MGIQILPKPTSLGAEVGGALGQGIAKGSEQGIQRGLVQHALGQLGDLPPNASAFDVAKSLISATAGIPGAERYVAQLFPSLLQAAQRRSLLPGTGNAPSSSPMGSAPQGAELSGSPHGGIPGQSQIASLQQIEEIAKTYPGDPKDVY